MINCIVLFCSPQGGKMDIVRYKLVKFLEKIEENPGKLGQRDCPFCHKKMAGCDGVCYNCNTYSRATDSLEKRFHLTHRGNLPYYGGGENAFHVVYKKIEEQ